MTPIATIRSSRRRALAAVLTIAVLGAALPATAADEAKDGEAGTSPGYSVIIDADRLPAGDAVVGVGRFELGPGASIDSPAGSQPPSIGIETLISGSYAVSSDGPLLIVRAGDDASGIAPTLIEDGSEVNLSPGDSVFYLDNGGADQRVRNAGDDTVVGFAAGIFADGDTSASPEVAGDYSFSFIDFGGGNVWDTVPRDDVLVSLETSAAAPTEASTAEDTITLGGPIRGTDLVATWSLGPAITADDTP